MGCGASTPAVAPTSDGPSKGKKVAPVPAKNGEKKGDVHVADLVCVLGGPGSGKSTVSREAAAKFGYTHISTGQLLRDMAAKADGTLDGREKMRGRKIAELMRDGKLLPAAHMIRLVKEAVMNAPTGKIILDGFPRTLKQAQDLEQHVRRVTLRAALRQLPPAVTFPLFFSIVRQAAIMGAQAAAVQVLPKPPGGMPVHLGTGLAPRKLTVETAHRRRSAPRTRCCCWTATKPR